MDYFVYVDYYERPTLSRKLLMKCIREKIPHSVFTDQSIPEQLYSENENVWCIFNDYTFEKSGKGVKNPAAVIFFEESKDMQGRLDVVHGLLHDLKN